MFLQDVSGLSLSLSGGMRLRASTPFLTKV
jgi:hypothetical protein